MSKRKEPKILPGSSNQGHPRSSVETGLVKKEANSETLLVLSKEPFQRTRRTTGGAEEYGNRQPTTEQPQEKEPQSGSIGRRASR
ncbi:hypothetical protein TNCV_2137611 [Trichonephila clavipes]|nr:hypothetical protein TNCV_2137611 [Trichonephila clavipes]